MREVRLRASFIRMSSRSVFETPFCSFVKFSDSPTRFTKEIFPDIPDRDESIAQFLPADARKIRTFVYLKVTEADCSVLSCQSRLFSSSFIKEYRFINNNIIRLR